MTGRRVLVPYSDTIPRGADLSCAWNYYMEYGAHLVALAHYAGSPWDIADARVLAKGRKVA